MTDAKRKALIVLFNLQESGIVNMWGAAPYLARAVKITEKEAIKILADWMHNWHYYKEEVMHETHN